MRGDEADRLRQRVRRLGLRCWRSSSSAPSSIAARATSLRLTWTAMGEAAARTSRSSSSLVRSSGGQRAATTSESGEGFPMDNIVTQSLINVNDGKRWRNTFHARGEQARPGRSRSISGEGEGTVISVVTLRRALLES